jgi:predicted DNA-binding transcriptional regulator
VSAGRSVNLIAISDLLFRSQVVTIPRIAEHLGVQYRSAQLNLESLLKVGILKEVEGTAIRVISLPERSATLSTNR